MCHVIRLQGAWETTVDSGISYFRRKFGRPRTVDANEHVWLVFRELPAKANITLNGLMVGNPHQAGHFEVNVTDLLQPRNQVTVALESPALLGEVVIEIRPSSFVPCPS